MTDVKCPTCKAHDPGCSRCDGTGLVPSHDGLAEYVGWEPPDTCPKCQGTGWKPPAFGTIDRCDCGIVGRTPTTEEWEQHLADLGAVGCVVRETDTGFVIGPRRD